MANGITYKITLRKRAAKEYLEALAWYSKRSLLAAENFRKSVNEAFSKIEADPERYRNSYKHFRELSLRRYPYLIVYFIDKTKNIIVVTTIFHHKRRPKKKYTK
ncbi:MAG: type II toxin-antitoxin system RelE/ParE family toxin [Flavisolibacter sp.]|nr:type II toxin-antitoxin system RelE/ParE family toxin [Flavisolibacter sp.]